MNEQMAIDRISEVENLTDNLDDEAASWLIRWGIEKSSFLIADMADAEKAGAKINDVMAFMRRLNEIIPARTIKKADDLKDDLKSLVELYANAFNLNPKVKAKALIKSAGSLKQQSPLEAVQSLITLVATHPPEQDDVDEAKK